VTRRVPVCAVVAVAALLCAASLFAQVAQPPARPSRPRFGGGAPPDPNRVRHDLLLDAHLLGGYQDNVTPFGVRTGGVTGRPSATVTSGGVGLSYSVGTIEKGLEISGRGTASYASTYRKAGQPPGYGGDLTVSGRIGLGQHTRVAASHSAQVSPYSSLGIFGGLSGGLAGGLSTGSMAARIPSVEANVANALFEGLTWGLHTSGSMDHEWTRRMSTMVGYSYNKQTHTTLVDNRTHAGRFAFTRKVGRSGSFRASYSRSVADLSQRGRTATSERHTITFGAGISREISRTRTLSIAGSGGASHVDSFGRQEVRQQYWKPDVAANASLDLGRTWTVAVDWRQATSVLPSPIFSPKTFFSRSANVSVGGYLGSRIELVFSGANSNGVVGRAFLGDEGAYKGYTGNAQMRIGLTRWWSAVASINHYQAHLSGSAAEALGTSADFHTNSVMVGFGWSLPLIDAGARRQAGRGGRN
jgi:hypothetical protein